MVADSCSVQFHDLDKVNLIAIGRLPRVLPYQRVPVEHVVPGPVPPDQLVGTALGSADEERAEFGMAAQYTAGLVQDPCDQRAFQNCVRKVEIEQSVDVVGRVRASHSSWTNWASAGWALGRLRVMRVMLRPDLNGP